MQQGASPLVLLAAGGTGGHLFPAEALAQALVSRSFLIELATDERAARYGKNFPARRTHVITSATVHGHDPVSLMRTAALLGVGTVQALRLIGRIKPAVVVGFGGYPTVPSVFAATLRRVPTLIHEQNAVMGRANRLLAPGVDAIATGFACALEHEPKLRAKVTRTGNPVRPAVLAAAAVPYVAADTTEPFRLVVFGGSQGARIMAEVVPTAVERLEPYLQMRLSIAQQAREEDIARVREVYARAKVTAEVAPFFSDLPARIAAAHLVVARAGASTVAELAAIGRPSILVPLPHALDQDQSANAYVLERAGAALRLHQDDFTPDRLASDISTLASAPQKLVAMAASARSEGTIDAAERLAELVTRVIKGTQHETAA
jgi:UDP-N-acetylglucosamine--N-acetylmuramyl-(pentapeptide) pyrophosphoryl-undecaprenol N-acetylglucosamine transferase